jgi:CelD/BcsL family acetyltransferase involved in cellulose biosynthesis
VTSKELRSGDASKVAVLEETRDFALLEEEWEDLYHNSPVATPLQSWGWLYSWWEHYGEGYGLRLITVRNGDGLLIGVLPLVLERRTGFGRLLLAGTGPSDYLDVLVRAGFEEEVFTAGARTIQELGSWSVADLQQLHPEAAAWDIFERWLGPGGCVRQDSCPIIEVGSWEELMKSLSRSLRSTVRRSIKRAEADGLRRHVAGVEEAERAARKLVALHRESWEGRGIGREHLSRRFECLIAAAAYRMTASGAGAVSEFWRDGEVVISSLLLFGRDHVGTHTLGASQDALQRYQWSSLYIWDAVEAAHEGGKGYVDLLQGEEPYKLRWSHRVVPTHRLILGRTRYAWLPYAAYHALRSRAKWYARSEDSPQWVKGAVERYRGLRRAVASRVRRGR